MSTHTTVPNLLMLAPAEILAARIAESRGEKVTKDLHEGILFRKYLEGYMRQLSGKTFSREFVLQELQQKKPHAFILQSLRDETYRRHRSFMDKQAHDVQKAVLDSMDKQDL